MTPKQAKDILGVLQEISTPEGCQPYVDAIWSAEQVAKDPQGMDLAELNELRTLLPALLAEAAQEALQAQDGTGGPIFFDYPHAQVFRMACQKQGIPLRGFQSSETGSGMIYPMEDGRFTLNMPALAGLAARARVGGRGAGA